MIIKNASLGNEHLNKLFKIHLLINHLNDIYPYDRIHWTFYYETVHANKIYEKKF